MISENIKFLRKKNNMSQEALAEKLGVSRQSVAKWENGDSLPDILKCQELAELFDTNLDSLVSFYLEDNSLEDEPDKGKFAFGTVKVGERGQIVIPKQAREIFKIQAGDLLLVLGDTEKGGLALAKLSNLGKIS